MTATLDSLATSVAAFVEDRPERSTFSLHDVLASVRTPVDAEHVVAALWDLVEDGHLTYGSDARFTVLCAPARLLATA